MIENLINNFSDEEMQDCCQLWGCTGDSGSLQEAFQNSAAVRTVLARLSEEEAGIFHHLYQDEDTTFRRKLKPYFKGLDIPALLEQLQSKALVYVMKNRARLDNSMDKIYLNDVVLETVRQNHLITDYSELSRPEFSIAENMQIDLELLAGYFGSYIPEKIFTICPDLPRESGNLTPVLLFSKTRYIPVLRCDNFWKPSPVKTLEIRPKAVLVLAELLHFLRSRSVMLEENERHWQPRKRDIGRAAEYCGIGDENAEMLLEHLFEESWIESREHIIYLARRGMQWLQMDLENKTERLHEWIEDILPEQKKIKVSRLLEKIWQKREAAIFDDPGIFVRNLELFLKKLSLWWTAGIISLWKNETKRIRNVESLHGIMGNERVEPGGVVISSNMDLHIYTDRIGILQRLYIETFCEAVLSEKVGSTRLDRKHFVHGMILGLSGARFLDILKTHADNDIPQNILFTLQEWIGNFHTISKQEAVLIHGDAVLIEEILHDRELKEFVLKKINTTTLMVENYMEKEFVRIMEEKSIFVHTPETGEE